MRASGSIIISVVAIIFISCQTDLDGVDIIVNYDLISTPSENMI